MGATPVFSHISLPPGGARAGSVYEAAFRVGHVCKDARRTTGIAVELPRGFEYQSAAQRPGWTLAVQPGQVSWRASTPEAELPNDQKAEFVLRGKLPKAPTTLWFKVRQQCDGGRFTDWSLMPASDSAADKPATPAARLDVLPADVAPVHIKQPWVRMAVPGQSGTGGFMTLSAPMGARLIAVQTPVAGVAEVHEMKMEGDRMQMRSLPALELPQRQPVELKPGGMHLMLMDLKQPLAAGSSVPLTLIFEDAQGHKSQRTVQAPVLQQAPGGDEKTGAAPHKH